MCIQLFKKTKQKKKHQNCFKKLEFSDAEELLPQTRCPLKCSQLTFELWTSWMKVWFSELLEQKTCWHFTLTIFTFDKSPVEGPLHRKQKDRHVERRSSFWRTAFPSSLGGRALWDKSRAKFTYRSQGLTAWRACMYASMWTHVGACVKPEGQQTEWQRR